MRLIHGLFLAGILLFSGTSHAVICSVSNVTAVNFGAINPLATATPMAAMTFSYTCTKELGEVLGGVTLCFNIGNSAGSGQVATRAMTSAGPPASTLNYLLYQDEGRTILWGNQTQNVPMVKLSLLNLTTVTGNLTLYGKLTTPQTGAVPGIFQDSYTAATAVVTRNTSLVVPPSTCGTATATTFPFTVTATAVKQCNIRYANNINVGLVNANQTGVSGSNLVGIACSNNTPYTIGLSPSNSNTAGSGALKGTRVGNTDTIPYQLRSTAGAAGLVWGNTAQNKVAGTGTGSIVAHTVYVTFPSVNYIPDSYTDTVTINVTY